MKSREAKPVKLLCAVLPRCCETGCYAFATMKSCDGDRRLCDEHYNNRYVSPHYEEVPHADLLRAWLDDETNAVAV